jgi:hypothetical protein
LSATQRTTADDLKHEYAGKAMEFFPFFRGLNHFEDNFMLPPFPGSEPPAGRPFDLH